MKNHIGLALLFSFLLFLSGCIDSESVVTVNKDGSGTIEETTLYSAQMSAMMSMAAAGFTQPGAPAAGMSLTVTEEQAKANASQMGMGVTLQSLENLKTPDGRQGQKVVYAFTD